MPLRYPTLHNKAFKNDVTLCDSVLFYLHNSFDADQKGKKHKSTCYTSHGPQVKFKMQFI